MASNIGVLLVSAVAIGTLTKWLMVGGQQAGFCAVCYYGDSKR